MFLTVLLLFLMLPFELAASEADERFQHQFIEIALGQEYQEGYSHLKRWDSPVRISIRDQVGIPDLALELLEEHINLLRRATGLSIQRTGATDPNLLIFLTSQARLEVTWSENAVGTLPTDALCAAQIKATATGEIVEASIFIPVDRATERGKLLSCLVEELTQSLGLINDSADVYPSIFNDRSKQQMITGLDWILLRTLYHSDLEPGMNLNQVRRQLPAIQQQAADEAWRAQGERLIRATQIYKLMEID